MQNSRSIILFRRRVSRRSSRSAFNGTSVFLDAGVRSGGDNGITEHINPVAERKVVFNAATIWGSPAKHSSRRRSGRRNWRSAVSGRS